MSEAWMKAYAQWEPFQQLIFSCIGLLVAFIVLLLVGLFLVTLVRSLLDAVSVWVRGWPPAEKEDTAKPVPFEKASSRTPLPASPGRDWKREQQLIAEEAAYQASVYQASLQPLDGNYAAKEQADLDRPALQRLFCAQQHCNDPGNNLGRCLKDEGRCTLPGECRRLVEQHRKPEP